MLLGGADLAPAPGGWVSAGHSQTDIERTVEAFEATLQMWKEEQPAAAGSQAILKKECPLGS